MGRATRWFKTLFGIKIHTREKNPTEFAAHSGRELTGLCHNPATIPPNITPAEAAWLRSFYTDNDKEQNKHAIAVAAATAAAADAAVAAAQAAVAVVRLTSQGRGTAVFGGSREKWAATVIQSVFRGFLARKALRALKGLVKIQALVRGFLVRKQAAATLQGMQALIRAQASVRAQKLRRLINNEQDCFPPHNQARTPLRVNLNYKYEDERSEQHPSTLHSRRLSASFEAAALNSFEESPKIVEVDTGCRPKSRSRRANDTPFQCLIPARTPFPDEECHFCSPRFASGPVTPARSACTDNYFRGGAEHPNYMAKTQSFTAKVRSHSAPRQRPEPGPKRRLSLLEMMESRNSLSGVRMQRSCSQAQEAVVFKNAVMGKLGRSSDFVRDNHFYHN